MCMGKRSHTFISLPLVHVSAHTHKKKEQRTGRHKKKKERRELRERLGARTELSSGSGSTGACYDSGE